jgi:hypothetical protein
LSGRSAGDGADNAIGNYAHGNGTGGVAKDLGDTHTNCDSNVWLGNDFGTANQSCIH